MRDSKTADTKEMEIQNQNGGKQPKDQNKFLCLMYIVNIQKLFWMTKKPTKVLVNLKELTNNSALKLE